MIPLSVSLCLTFIIFVFIKRISALPGQTDLFRFGISYLLLFGVISFQLFLYAVIGLSWSAFSLLAPWVVSGLWLSIPGRKHVTLLVSKETVSKVSFLLLACILLCILFVGFESVLRPVSSWDSWSNWMLKAKMFFIDGAILPMFSYTRSDYPIGISLFVAFFYFVLGRVDDTSVLILFFLFYLFSGLVIYSFLRRVLSFELTLCFTFLFLSLQNVIRHGGRYETGMADLALGYGILCVVSLFYYYIKSNDRALLLTLEIVSVICGFIKYEGFVFSLIVQFLLFYFLLREKRLRELFVFIVWVIPTVGWYLYKLYGGVQQHYIFSGTGIQFSRIPVIISSMSKEFLNVKNWNLLWPSFFFAVFLAGTKIPREVRYVLLLLLLQILSYGIVFVVTPVDFEAQLFATIDRLYLHLAPSAVLITAILAGPFLSERFSRSASREISKYH
jgi:hypothetical protein